MGAMLGHRGLLLGDSLEAQVRHMFAGGVPGAMIDPTRMEYCYQDSARTTLVNALGQPIGSTTDLSGNGNHPAQTTATRRALFQNEAKFDGVDDWWQIPFIDFSTTSKVTLIVSLRKASAVAGSGQIFLELGNGANAGGISIQAPTSAGNDFGCYLTGTSTADRNFTRTTGIYAPPTTKVVTALFDRSAPLADAQVVILVNGSVAPESTGTAVTTSIFMAGSLNIGARVGGSFCFDGSLCRLALIGRELTPSEYGIAQTWANQPVGVM